MNILDIIHKIEQDGVKFINWTENEIKQLVDYIRTCLTDTDAQVIADELVAAFKRLRTDLMSENTGEAVNDFITLMIILSKLHDAKEGLDVAIQLLSKVHDDYVAFKANIAIDNFKD